MLYKSLIIYSGEEKLPLMVRNELREGGNLL